MSRVVWLERGSRLECGSRLVARGSGYTDGVRGSRLVLACSVLGACSASCKLRACVLRARSVLRACVLRVPCVCCACSVLAP